MSETTTATVATPEINTKKAVKSAPAKKAAKPEANGKESGLRKPQLRILAALAKASRPLTRGEIAAKAQVDVAGCTEWVGSSDPDKRAANDAKHFPSLISLGYVRPIKKSDDEPTSYEATAKGRTAVSKASK